MCDKIWPNCAIDDTSMSFGTHLDFIITKIIAYRAISNFAHEGVGGHLSKMAAVNLFSHILTTAFVTKCKFFKVAMSTVLRLTFSNFNICDF